MSDAPTKESGWRGKYEAKPPADYVLMRQSGTVDPRTVALGRTLEEVRAEVDRALAKFPAFNSPHEGYAVIKEELDELWDEVKTNGEGRTAAATNEAIQIAAMAVRFVMDLDCR